MRIDEKTYKRLPEHLKSLFEKLPNPGSEEVLAAFAVAGERTSGKLQAHHKRNLPRLGTNAYGDDTGNAESCTNGRDYYGDTGTAARFFYTAKASRKERGEGNSHPTVKPLALMEYLVRLVTPPGGVILDPFLGSGTTGVAAIKQGFAFVGIEREPAYFAIAERRIAAAQAERPLFAEAGT